MPSFESRTAGIPAVRSAPGVRTRPEPVSTQRHTGLPSRDRARTIPACSRLTCSVTVCFCRNRPNEAVRCKSFSLSRSITRSMNDPSWIPVPNPAHAHRFRDLPGALPPLNPRIRRSGRRVGSRRRRDRGTVRRLRAQAQFLRFWRRHRTSRCGATAAFRAPGGALRGDPVGQGPGVLRRGQHPDAGRRQPRPQGQLLQVHQRDPQRARGYERPLRPALCCGGQRSLRRRRLRARTGP